VGSPDDERKPVEKYVALSAVGMNFVILKLFFFFRYRFVVSDKVGNRVYSDFGFQDADAESQGKPGKKKS
jgi:hypothetical protein